MKIKKEKLVYQNPFFELKQSNVLAVIRVSIAVLFFAFKIINAASHEELFLQGNSNFLKGNFKAARNYYEQIEPKSSAVWHNLGNCYFNESNKLKALISWKRAEKGASFSQLKKLLEAENRVAEQMHFSHSSATMLKFKQLLTGIPFIFLQLILLLLLLLLLCLWYRCFKKSKIYLHLLQCNKKYALMLIAGILALLLIIATKEKYLHKKEAVVTQDKAAVYIGPEVTFSQKTVLPLGCIVQVLEKKENMIKVRFSQGSGWVLLDNIEII